MLDHLNEIRSQVHDGKFEEANLYVDGIVNAAEDLENSLNVLFKQEILRDESNIDSHQYKIINQDAFDRLLKKLPRVNCYPEKEYKLLIPGTEKYLIFSKMTTAVFELKDIKLWVPAYFKQK